MVRSAMDFAAMAEYIYVWIRSPKSAPKSLREAGVAGAALCAPYRIAISIQPLHEHVARVRAQAHGGNPAQHFPLFCVCDVSVPWVTHRVRSPCHGSHTV